MIFTSVVRPSSPAVGWRTRPLATPPGLSQTGPVPQQTTYDWARPDLLPRLHGKPAQPPPGSSTTDGPGGGGGGEETVRVNKQGLGAGVIS